MPLNRFASGLALLTALSLGTVGCSQNPNQDAGVLLGAAAGGLLGSTVGRGSGRAVATMAGALAGAFIGNNIGRKMDELDRVQASHALERSPTGSAVSWANPDSGARYEMTPTRTYQSSAGDPCRDFTTRAWIEGKEEVVHGTACRDGQGTWRTR